MPDVILVDELDNQTGTMEKMEAHAKGLLHRAFSIFILNDAGQILLQQRADEKYHNGGMWTNTCCSHPLPGEDIHAAAIKRLGEEMGFTTSLARAFDFTYKALFENGLTEYEFDHVFVGYYNGPVYPDPVEVKQYRWCSIDEIRKELVQDPEKYTAWFRIAFPMVCNRGHLWH